MSGGIVWCMTCGEPVWKRVSDINRSPTGRFFCDLKCAGAARCDGKTKAQRIAAKAAYDADYRAKNRSMLKVKKAAYHAATYDPERARRVRKANADNIRAYRERHLRTPRYRALKRNYDIEYRAAEYGEFSGCHPLLVELERELRRLVPSKYQRQINRGYFDRPHVQERKRDARQNFG